jgi:hypothetical protein
MFAQGKRLAVVGFALTLAACAARVPPRPSGQAAPDPTAIDAFRTATAACRGFRSLTAELALSGRAGGEKIRGRVVAGLDVGGSIRLEGLAPFGAPVFILAGRQERGTLLLPRDHRVLRDTGIATVLERLTGLALSADDLRLVVSGCLTDGGPPSDGRRWTSGFQAVSLGTDRVAYLRIVQGQPVVVAADYGGWRVDYGAHASGWPSTVRVRVAADATTDITARVGQLETNTTIAPAAFVVEVPAGTESMTIDELRSVAPLVPKP